jgi:hypothetical protein
MVGHPLVLYGSQQESSLVFAGGERLSLVRVDADGRLEVVAGPFGVGVDLVWIGGNPVVSAGVGVLAVGGPDDDDQPATAYPVAVGGQYRTVITADPVDNLDTGRLLIDAYRRLRLVGSVLDDGVADATEAPLKLGGVASANPAAAPLSAAGDMGNLIIDLERYLRTSPRSHDYATTSDRSFEIAPLSLQVLEESLLDTTNHAVTAGINYPSDDGLVMMGYKDLALTGKLICGAGDNAVTMIVQGTNDEDATPANRDWITLYAYRTDTNTVVNSVACAAGNTVTFAWDFDNCNYRYVRVNLVIANTGVLSNTIIIKIRRKAL